MIEPYKPHQCAIVFQNDAASGETLGHYCTVACVCDRDIRKHPFRPKWWRYRVFVPYFNTYWTVAARDLFVTGDVDPTDLPAEPQPEQPRCELRFDSPVAENNDTLEGAYRLPDRGWEHFCFQKCDQQIPNYQLRLPVQRHGLGAGCLAYNVPQTERLDLQFVLSALTEIFGVTFWQLN